MACPIWRRKNYIPLNGNINITENFVKKIKKLFFSSLFWSIIIALAIYAAILLSVQNVNRYYANPTVVSIQKDYRNWFNPFPSATACFINKVDEVFVDEYIEE